MKNISFTRQAANVEAQKQKATLQETCSGYFDEYLLMDQITLSLPSPLLRYLKI